MCIIDAVLLFVLAGIWGSSFAFMRFLSPLIGPVATIVVRMMVAGIALAAFFAVTGFRAGWRKNWPRFLAIGVLNSSAPFTLFAIGALHLPGAVEAILNATTPMFGALAAAVFLGERITAKRSLGLLLGIAGVGLMTGLGAVPRDLVGLLSAGACLLAALFYGVASVYIKKRAADIPSLAVAGGSQLLGGLALAPFLAAAPPRLAAVDLRVGLAALVFGLLCSGVAYVIFYRLIARVGPTRTLTVTFLAPIFAMLWGFLFLGEAVTLSMIVGVVVILGGTYLVVAPQRAAGAASGSEQEPPRAIGPAPRETGQEEPRRAAGALLPPRLRPRRSSRG